MPARGASSVPRLPTVRKPLPRGTLLAASVGMTKKRLLAIGILAAAPRLGDAQVPAPAAPPPAPPSAQHQVVGTGNLESVVSVRDVAVGSTQVGGTLVNLTNDELRDVRLRVRDMFLWDNERRPGTDDFSRAEEFVVRGPIPPRGGLAFTAPRTELPLRSDGEYRTTVDVTALTRQPVTAQAPAAPLGDAPPVGSPPPAEDLGTSPPAGSPSSVVTVPVIPQGSTAR